MNQRPLRGGNVFSAAVKTERFRIWLGWILLLLAFLIGLLTLSVYSFGDEGDGLTMGLLISRGYVLYRDVFSHHFPFPYYWAAAAIAVLGKQLPAIRLSLWLFQVAAFAIAMKLSRFHLSLGLAALGWALVRHLYNGNMILYSSFSSLSLMVVFSITMAILLRKGRVDGKVADRPAILPRIGWIHCLAIGLFSAIAILSDPLSLYAVLLVLAYLFITDRRLFLLSSACAAAGLLTYAAYLVLSGTLQAFWEEAILFNSQVYAKYVDGEPVRIGLLLEQAAKGLKVLDPRWLNFDPLRTITPTRMDDWAFTGFFYRLLILMVTLLLLAQKDYRAGTFLYLFSVATLLNRDWGFRAAGFVLLAWLVAAAAVTGEWWKRDHARLGRVQVAFGALVGIVVLWLGLRIIHFTFVQERELLSYDWHFARREEGAEGIKAMACDQPDVLLGYYPGPGYTHWFTGLAPVSEYTYMYPWVAEVGQASLIRTLEQEGVSAIVRIRDREVRGMHPRDYLRDLYALLDSSFVEIEEGIYLSPYLAAKCEQQNP